MRKTIILFMFLLTACAPQKIMAEADAYKTRAEADQAVLDSQQERAQKSALDAITLQETEREQAIKDAGLTEAKEMYVWAVNWIGLTVMLVLMYVIVSVGRGVSFAVEGVGQAAARKAMLQANLIYLDAKTGNFPQLIEYLGNGRYSLTDMNDKSTRFLDTRNEPDRMAVQGAIAVRHALVMSAAASRSKDASGVASIQPFVIDAEVQRE